MMKRRMALLLAAVLLAGMAGTALADVDLSTIRNSELYYIDVNDNGYAFVGSIVPYDLMTVSHPNSVASEPSIAYSDIVVSNYYSSGDRQQAAWRLWLEYRGGSYLGITAITLTWDGTDYTFEGVGDSSRMQNHGNYVQENARIVFGSDNMLFWLSFLLRCEGLDNKMEIIDWSMPMVLHGTRDVATELSGYTLLDLYLVGEAMYNISGFDGLLGTSGSPVTTYTPEEPAEEPAAEPAEEPTEEPAVEPAEEPTGEPAAEPVEESAEELSVKAVEEADVPETVESRSLLEMIADSVAMAEIVRNMNVFSPAGPKK